MHVLELECAPAEADLVIAELWARGVAGIEQNDSPEGRCILKAWFEFEIETGPFEAYSSRWYAAVEQDWVAYARSLWQPVPAGSRFFLVPEWRDDPTPPGRLRLEMRPGRACGTGWAAPTQLMLECMERAVHPGAAVLDVGTGSGILAVAAALLGAGRIIACDIDHEATVIAAERLRDERVPAAAFTGSVRSVRGRSCDVVLANLNAAALLDLAGEMDRVLAPGGRIVMSGFRGHDLGRVQRVFRFTEGPFEKDGWLAAIC